MNNKYLKKIEYQEKNNPGHKTSYTPPLRPRSTVFKSRKTYDRARLKTDLRKENFDR